MITALPSDDEHAAMTPLEVVRKAAIARDVYLYELARADHAPLPAFDAGAHVTVLTPNGLTRRYSLCNAPRERGRYLIAVKRDAQGQGGSASLVDGVQQGDMLPVSAPRNYFALDPQARSHLLVAGGIGITPILAMFHELRARQSEFRLVYLARTPESAAFLDVLASPELAARVQVHHSHGDPARAFDLSRLLAERAQGAHVYCCGPRRLMQAVREGTRHWPPASVHFEDFGSSEQAALAADRAFVVKLRSTGAAVEVPCGVSILEALRRHGLSLPSSCESGTCGSCRTPLLSGVAQHRDYVLDDDQQDKEIMICVSRAESSVLELGI